MNIPFIKPIIYNKALKDVNKQVQSGFLGPGDKISILEKLIKKNLNLIMFFSQHLVQLRSL